MVDKTLSTLDLVDVKEAILGAPNAMDKIAGGVCAALSKLEGLMCTMVSKPRLLFHDSSTFSICMLYYNSYDALELLAQSFQKLEESITLVGLQSCRD